MSKVSRATLDGFEGELASLEGQSFRCKNTKEGIVCDRLRKNTFIKGSSSDRFITVRTPTSQAQRDAAALRPCSAAFTACAGKKRPAFTKCVQESGCPNYKAPKKRAKQGKLKRGQQGTYERSGKQHREFLSGKKFRTPYQQALAEGFRRQKGKTNKGNFAARSKKAHAFAKKAVS